MNDKISYKVISSFFGLNYIHHNRQKDLVDFYGLPYILEPNMINFKETIPYKLLNIFPGIDKYSIATIYSLIFKQWFRRIENIYEFKKIITEYVAYEMGMAMRFESDIEYLEQITKGNIDTTKMYLFYYKYKNIE